MLSKRKTNMTGKYILDEDGNPVEEPNLEKWSKWMQDTSRRVAMTDLASGKVVSTVFLGLDHSFTEEGPPMLFETMVFKAKDDYSDEYCERYSTKDEALAGHELARKKFS